jgi:glycosyltransferase involved in cell wall biosynthesis
MISVVMPVHNAMPHLDEAVRSILDQTYAQFEFVIFDDGSTDGSTERLREWALKDARIRLIESRKNLGPVGSSNAVVELATGALIARMDADDVSLPNRLERQLEILQQSPDVGLVACVCDVIDAAGRQVREPDLWRLARKSWFAPFAHGSALFRKQLYDAVGGYRDECAFWEDQDLFVRMLVQSELHAVTLTEPLYRVRYSRVSTRVASDRHRVDSAVDRMYRCVDRLNEGCWYDNLLKGPLASSALDPRVFIATGSLTLWANGRPQLLKRLISEGTLGFDVKTLAALVWTSWASLSPSTLRSFLKLLVRLRNFSSSKRQGRKPVDWSPSKLSEVRQRLNRNDLSMDKNNTDRH